MIFRSAKREDVPAIVRLLAEDELGSKRELYEDPLPADYYDAFAEIEAQGGNQIILAVEEQAVIGCLQLTMIPGLARKGMKRALIEGVRGEAHRFYERLGFIASHEGMKLIL